MQGNNTNNPEDQVQDELNKLQESAKGIGKGIGKGAKKAGAKALKAGAKALKAGAKSAKAVGIIGSLGMGGVFLFIGFIVLLIFVILPSMKSYDARYVNNGSTIDRTVSYSSAEGQSGNENARMLMRSISGTSDTEVAYGESRIVLSEENQAIENYHYYQAMKSLYNNKYYYPIEGVDLEGLEGEATMEVLLEKGVFIENKEKNIIEFNDKYIGDLKKVDEEKDKIKVKDEYNREAYFQLPEELLGMLNTTVYNGKVVYDKPFLNGVDFKYTKTEDKDLGRPVYEYSTNYSSLSNSKVNEFGLGSVFIYKPTFELGMESDGNINGEGVDGLLYMGDSLFEAMKEVDVPEERIVATSGYTVQQGFDEHLPKVIEKKPRLVVTSYGSNDCVGEVSLDEFYDTYKKLVEELKKNLPDTKVYLTMLNMSESKYSEVGKYNEKIQAVAQDTGATVIDSRELFKGEGEKFLQEKDKLHFTSTEGLGYWRSDIEKKIGVEGENKDETVTEDMDVDKINEVKLKYILDSVITFAGVYKFEYEIEAKGEGGQAVNQKEKPSKVIRQSKDEAYIYKYLENFSAQVPKKLYQSFEYRHLVRAFKGNKGSLSNSNASGDGAVENSGSGDLEQVEKWRPMVEEIAAGYGINPNLILCMIWAESSGNPHTGNKNYKGLVAMGANHSWLKPYFIEGDEVNIGGDYRKTGTSNDPRIPSCPSKGPHDDAEHERAAKFQIHYACRRVTDQMSIYSKKMFDKDPTALTAEEMFYVAAASIGSYNTGEGGQNTMRKLAGYDYAMLYSPNGEKWKEYHYKANAEHNGKLNSKMNCTYIKKMYDFYPQLSGGIPFNESGDLSLYDPSLWFIVKKDAGKFDSLAENTTTVGTNGVNMNAQFVGEYIEYEDDISVGYSGVVSNVVDDKVDLLLDQSVGMIEGKVYLQCKENSSAFWRDGYEKQYFSDGVPSRPPAGYTMESGIWKDKIGESEFTGDTDEIIQLAKVYGKGMFKVISKAVGQISKPYSEDSAGTMSYDMAGLIWYIFNYAEEASLFKLDKIETYYESFANEVKEDDNGSDLRPGDISFFTEPSDLEEKATDAIIYLGNDAGLYVSKEVERVVIVKYSEFKLDINKRIYLGSKRILKFTQGLPGELNENKNALAGFPEGFVESDWVFPVLFEKKEDIALTDGAGVRKIHPATDKPNIPHFGVDYSGPEGTPIIASKAGSVIAAGDSGNAAGWIVQLDHGDGTTSAYYHLVERSTTVSIGDKVEQGQVIGGLGNTGVGTGAHLHFEIAVGLPNHVKPATGRDMRKFVPIQNMFKELGIRDAREVPHNTVYPGNKAYWDNRNS